ncbi:MAG: GreA/GreB family elongation factor [Patescibacteria group bacterium]|jgi:transcription elongation factor GreA
MRVPIRKPGKYTHLKPDPHLTEEKYNELKSKLVRMLKSRPPLIEEVKFHALNGDFSENAAYQIAKGRLRGLNQRIIELEDHLKQAIIISPRNNFRIEAGHKVTVLVRGKEKIYKILGSSETDPDKGIISRNSPIGSALLGRKAGDRVKVRLAEKEVIYEILKIE